MLGIFPGTGEIKHSKITTVKEKGVHEFERHKCGRYTGRVGGKRGKGE